jgi:hypothetical protein
LRLVGVGLSPLMGEPDSCARGVQVRPPSRSGRSRCLMDDTSDA